MPVERKILIADDHAIIRYGVSLIIKEEFNNALISQAEDFNRTLRLIEKEQFDLLILDINIPGGNNIQMLDMIKLKQPTIKILIFTAYDEEMMATRYMKAGADGYVVKDSSDIEIRKAINKVLQDEYYVSQSILSNMLSGMINRQNNDNPLTLLSNRENDVLQLMLQGKSRFEIADHLSIHSTTVSTYKARIFEKMQVRNMVELIAKYRLLSNR